MVQRRWCRGVKRIKVAVAAAVAAASMTAGSRV
jgi:hypothetical protein